MTPEEQQMVGGLIERVQQTRLAEKDPDAEQMLAQGLGRTPDALYILAQTVLVQNMALEQAQAQIRQLQQQPAKTTSFLGSLLGHHDPPPAPVQSYPPQQGWAQQPQQYGNPGYASPQFSPMSSPSSSPQFSPSSAAGGFLRSAATTAAGVAAGALAFQGIESLMHGGFGGGGYGGGFGGGGFGGGRPMEETIVNNYYDEPGSRESHHEQAASFDDSRGDSHGDSHGDNARLEDAGYETRGGDLDTNDVNSDLDDSSFNDPGDSSGGGDDGLV